MQKTSFLLIALVGIAGPVQAALPTAKSVAWRAFADEQYGTRVKYPNSVFGCRGPTPTWPREAPGDR